MKSIRVTMQDLYTGEEVSREIDLSLFAIHEAHSEEKQRQTLNDWIDTRGNQQHDTCLELVSWGVR